MTNDEKRKLLTQVLAGNTEALRAYQLSQSQHHLADSGSRGWVIDARAYGGSIVGPDGAEMTPEELEAYPLKNRVWTVHDFTGGRPVHAPDEDYDYFAEKRTQ